MQEVRLGFECYHEACADESPTIIVVRLADHPPRTDGTREIHVSCTRNHDNLIDVPPSVNQSPPTLGGGGSGGGSRSGPLKGRRP